jgi:hypothetical protein
MKRAKLFKNNKAKYDFLELLFEDYVNKDLTVKELSEKYGYGERQIRYLIDRYLLVKKGKGKGKRMKGIKKVTKLGNGKVLADGKIAKKTTLEDLICKSEIYCEQVREKRERMKSTNKKVENK